MIENVVQMNILLDFYGKLLSEKQYRAVEMYYNYDYSLNEIAEELNISKQAVSNNLKRAVINLKNFESELNLIETFEKKQKERETLKILFNELRDSSKDLDYTIFNEIYSIIFSEEEVY